MSANTHLHSNNPGTTAGNNNTNQGRNSGRAYNGSGALNSITQIYGVNNSANSGQNPTSQNANHHHHMLKMIKKSQIDTTNVG